MTRPEIEPRSPRPLANTLTIMPMSGSDLKKSDYDDLYQRCTNCLNYRLCVICVYLWAEHGIRSIFFTRSEFNFPSRQVGIPRLKSLVSPITGERIVGFILFSRIFSLYEMQTALSKIWTLVAVSIFYNGSHYTMNASIVLYQYLRQFKFLYSIFGYQKKPIKRIYFMSIFVLLARTFAVIRKRFFKVTRLTELFENIKIDDVLSILQETGLYEKIWRIKTD